MQCVPIQFAFICAICLWLMNPHQYAFCRRCYKCHQSFICIWITWIRHWDFIRYQADSERTAVFIFGKKRKKKSCMCKILVKSQYERATEIPDKASSPRIPPTASPLSSSLSITSPFHQDWHSRITDGSLKIVAPFNVCPLLSGKSVDISALNENWKHVKIYSTWTVSV